MNRLYAGGGVAGPGRRPYAAMVTHAGRRAARRSARVPLRGARLRRHRRHLIVLWVLVAVIAGLGSFTGGLLSAPVDFTAPAPPKSALLLDYSGKVFATVRSPYPRPEVPEKQIPQGMRDAIVSAGARARCQTSGAHP